MVKSRRAIPSSTLSLPIFWIVPLLVIAIAGGLLWIKTADNVKINGLTFLKKRLGTVTGKKISAQNVSLTFPNHLVINNIKIFDNNNKDLLIKAKRLEIDLSLLSMITGRLRTKKVRVLSPDIKISRTAENSFGLPGQLMINGSYPSKSKWPARLLPFHWPLDINPNLVEIIGGYGHIEDELDTFPQLDGRFDITINRSQSGSLLDIDSGQITLDDISLFHQGIEGNVSGTITINNQELQADLNLTLAKGGKIEIRSKIANYKKKPITSFDIKAENFDIKNLALIKFPPFELASNTNVSGNLTISKPFIYDHPFESLVASIIYTDGKWRIDAIDLTLTSNKGKITGSIIPSDNKESKLAAAQLFFQAGSSPLLENSTYNIKRSLADPIWQSPEINSELEIDYSAYPIQVKVVKITSGNGDIFAKGQVDLYSGFVGLKGSFLNTAKNQKSSSSKAKLMKQILISGSLFSPDFSEITPDVQ